METKAQGGVSYDDYEYPPRPVVTGSPERIWLIYADQDYIRADTFFAMKVERDALAALLRQARDFMPLLFANAVAEQNWSLRDEVMDFIARIDSATEGAKE